MSTSDSYPVSDAERLMNYIQRYHSTLQHSPEKVYKFYSEPSSVLHIDGTLQTSGMSSLVKSLNYCEFDISTVHSTESWVGGVLVVVDGRVQVSRRWRNFTESFTLVTDRKTFSIVNAIFKFIDSHPPGPYAKFSFGSHPISEQPDSLQKGEINKQMISKSNQKEKIGSSWGAANRKTVLGFGHGRTSEANEVWIGLVPFRPNAYPYVEQLPAILDHKPSSFTFRRMETFQSKIPNTSKNWPITGKSGERIAFDHLREKFKKRTVTWVNESEECGKPYDIVIGDWGSNMEYFEVKATTRHDSDWFHMSPQQWAFAAEKRDKYTIVHVLLSDEGEPSFATFQDPVKLCKDRELKLIIQMPEDLQRATVP